MLLSTSIIASWFFVKHAGDWVSGVGMAPKPERESDESSDECLRLQPMAVDNTR